MTAIEGIIYRADFDWLDYAACGELDLEVDDFFTGPGHPIASPVLEACRSCPVRRDCLTHAYKSGAISGYFGGVSPGQRRNMTLKQALRYIAKDRG
jgi:WhiB family transcriptional regulator, redox-sensing transcriptional regulator